MIFDTIHRDPILLQQLLSETIVKSPYIRLQDTKYVYRAVGATGVGRRVQFEWVKDNFPAIKVRHMKFMNTHTIYIYVYICINDKSIVQQ